MSLDSTIDFSSDVLTGWAIPIAVNSSYFYYRAVGYIIPAETGLYTVGVKAGDGANLLIGGTPIVTGLSWRMTANDSLEYTQSGQIMLTAGKFYSIVVEWQHGAGAAYKLQLLWTLPTVNPSLGEIEIVPSSCLSSSSTTVTGNLTSAWWNGTSGLWFPAGAGIIDFAAPHPNKTLDHIADGVYRSLAGLSGGFANPMLAEGDMIYEDASLGPARLPIGEVNQVLTVVSGKPTSAAATGGSGTQGATGTQGPSGGVQGAQGTQGAVGTGGTQGATGTGTQGTTGNQGATGTGTQGITGAGTQGVTGTQGVQGPTGGVQGTQGSTGVGTQGGTGAQGTTGTGTQGTVGSQGASGGGTTVGSMVTHGCCGTGTNTGWN